MKETNYVKSMDYYKAIANYAFCFSLLRSTLGQRESIVTGKIVFEKSETEKMCSVS